MKTKTSCNTHPMDSYEIRGHAHPRGLTPRQDPGTHSHEFDTAEVDERIGEALAPHLDTLHAHAASARAAQIYTDSGIRAEYVSSPDANTRTYLVRVEGVEGCSLIDVDVDRTEADDATPAYAEAIQTHAESPAYDQDLVANGVRAEYLGSPDAQTREYRVWAYRCVDVDILSVSVPNAAA